MLPPPLIGFPPIAEREEIRSSIIGAHLHGSYPSADAYGRDRRVQLGEAVLNRKRIYLDLKYWIYFRDVLAGNPLEQRHVRLFDVIVEQVHEGTAICPLADSAFTELLKQGDRTKRLATARVMDELSQGVSLRMRELRVQAELLHFLRRHNSPPASLYPLEQMVWTRTAFVLGDIYPANTGLEPTASEAITRGFDDVMWTYSLEELLACDDDTPQFESKLYEQIALNLNQGKFRHQAELKSFRDTYKIELRGVIDAYGEVVSGALPYLFTVNGAETEPTEAERQEAARILSNALYEVLVRDAESRDLPTLNIQAGIHAAIRWDTQRRYNANDWLDIAHAVAGLPYCDIFLTERSLASLLRSPHLHYDHRYGTIIVHGVDEAIETIANVGT